MSLLGLIQKSSFKVALKVPRIKLPKLALSALLVYTLPKIALPGFSLLGKAASIGAGLLSSLTPFQQKLSSMFTSISNLTPGNALNYAKNVITSGYNQISNIASGVIKSALGNATAAVDSAKQLVNSIGSTVSGIEQSVVQEINKVHQLFSTQTKNVKRLITDELNVSSGNTQTINQVSAVQAQINSVINQSTTNLSNAEIKKLQEDPKYFDTFTANVSQQAINSAAQTVVAKNNVINNNVNQYVVVDELGSAPLPQPIAVNEVDVALIPLA